MQRVLTVAMSAVLVVAGVWSVRLARADAAAREGTEEGIRRAMEMMPGNSAYLAMLASWQEASGVDAAEVLERVAQLNPTLASPRLRLGMAAELRGDFAVAERWLLEAASLDKQLEPRWALAGFYWRRGRTPEFWVWMRAALEVSYGDRTAAFDLCWQATGDAAAVLRVIPESGPVRDAYLRYVVSKPRAEAIAAAARGVADTALRYAAVDALIGTARYADAIEVWRGSGRPAPSGVTSPRFDVASSGHGFDWRFVTSEGVTHQQLEQGRGHRVRLSGKQSEAVVLLRQYVGGLSKGSRYQLRISIEGAPAGLEWRVSGQPVAGSFLAPADVALLELRYARPRGAVRAEAAIDVKEVIVSALQ